MTGSTQGNGTFELLVRSLHGQDVTVLSFRGVEELSRPFRFDVVWDADLESAVVDAMPLGEPATLIMQCPSGPRVVRGIVDSVRLIGVVRAGRSRVRVRIVPRLAALKRRTNSRIFQELTTQEIVAAVLKQAGIACRWELKGKYAKRTYCVQHVETDFDFVSRLLAEEGIFYFFDSGGAPSDATDVVEAVADLAGAVSGADDAFAQEETVVFADSAGYPAILAASTPGETLLEDVEAELSAVADLDDAEAGSAPSLVYKAAGGMIHEERVDSIVYDRTVRSNVSVLKDYDFRRPLLDLTVTSPSGAAEKLLGLAEKVATHAPGSGERLEVYEYAQTHELLSSSDPGVQRQAANRRLDQLKRRARVYKATSNCRRIEAGRRFVLEGHAQAQQFDREYVVVKVEHQGKIAEGTSSDRAVEPTYENRFECVPSDVVYRPTPPKRLVRQVIETATVVGPPGKEIYSDEFGRIKVQFHWDRLGKRNEWSSCWMRTLESWGGAGWGTQFIPRVGMEVVVGFLGGDEDRPFVLGAAHNATHPLPFRDERTSGIRTNSVGQIDGRPANGHNELSFHDEAGREEMHLRAERDLDVHVGRTSRHEVMHDEVRFVGNHRHEEIGGDLRVQARGDHNDLAMGSRNIGARADLNLRSGGGVRLKAAADLVVESGHTLSLKGGSQLSAVIGRKGHDDGLGSIHVYGNQELSATGKLTLSAEQGLEIRCGNTTISITPKGVEISGDSIKLSAKEVKMKGAGPSLEIGKDVKVLSKTMRFIAEGASLTLNKEAALKGAQVKLDCDHESDDSPKDTEKPPETQTLHLRVTDVDFKPYAGKRYEVLASGTTLEGTTTADGVIDRKIPKEAKLANVTVWTDEFPSGPTRHWDVRIEKFEAASSVQGAKARLLNLGYFNGPIDDSLTDAFVAALKEFKGEHMPAADNDGRGAGNLCPKTANAIEAIHGH